LKIEVRQTAALPSDHVTVKTYHYDLQLVLKIKYSVLWRRT